MSFAVEHCVQLKRLLIKKDWPVLSTLPGIQPELFALQRVEQIPTSLQESSELDQVQNPDPDRTGRSEPDSSC